MGHYLCNNMHCCCCALLLLLLFWYFWPEATIVSFTKCISLASGCNKFNGKAILLKIVAAHCIPSSWSTLWNNVKYCENNVKYCENCEIVKILLRMLQPTASLPVGALYLWNTAKILWTNIVKTIRENKGKS